MKKAAHYTEATHFEQIPNVGPRIAADLRRVGLAKPTDLRRRDPYGLYAALCDRTGVLHDPCIIDVFISAIRFMQGEPARPWWVYTAERKVATQSSAKRRSGR